MKKIEKKPAGKILARAVDINSVKDKILTRGRIFEGFVKKKFPKRIVLEFERTVFIQKYERFSKKITRIHARLPDNLVVNVGDLVRVQECRPLSKIIHHVVISKVKSSQNGGIKT